MTCRSKNKLGVNTAWFWTPTNGSLTGKTLRITKEDSPPGLNYFDEVVKEREIEPFGTFRVKDLKWTHVPKEASGYYRCEDLDDDLAPPSIVKLSVVGNKVKTIHG